MISFLPQKQVDYARISGLLAVSHRANHYTNDGPVKRMLESFLHSFLSLGNDKRVLCCTNGTAALHSIMLLVSSKCGVRNWVTPAFTFPSCVVGHDLDIDVLDISDTTYTLPLDKNVLSKYGGVVITNLFGSYVDIPKWVRYCKDNNKVLIFDNAASPLSSYNGKNICSFGSYSFGSLHHTKYLGFGEGGFIVCPADEYDALHSIMNFGFFGDRVHKTPSSNFKMSDVSAAFILSHMQNYNLKSHLEKQDALVKGISKLHNAKPFNFKQGTVYNTFPVVFNKEIDESHFCDAGIKAHKYYEPLSPLPHSLFLYNRIINFPLYASLSDNQISIIIEEVSKV